VRGWELHPDVLAVLAVAAGAYATGVWRVRRWRTRRSIAYAAGLFALGVALLSPLDAAAQTALRPHMAQHMLIAMVAAPLLVAGAPLTLALRAARPPARGRLTALLNQPAARALVHPIATWSLFALVLLGSHFTPVYDAAVGSDAVHAAEHAAYLWAALLFWLPVLGAGPLPRRLGWLSLTAYHLATMPVVSIVGVVLLYAPEPLYASYPLLADQQAAGMVMWLGGTMMLGFAAVAIGWRELLREERHQVARERRLEAAG